MMQKSAPDSYRSHSGPARRLFSSSFHRISGRSVQKNRFKENVTSHQGRLESRFHRETLNFEPELQIEAYISIHDILNYGLF